MIEGGKDRPGILRRQNLLLDASWNERTGRACRKQRYINKTGTATVYGELVTFHTTTDYAVKLTAASDDECIGAIYEAGVADGSECLVVTGGSCHVLHENGLTTSALPGNWVKTGGAAGRADAIDTGPNPATRWLEVGHCCETVIPATNALVEITAHFN